MRAALCAFAHASWLGALWEQVAPSAPLSSYRAVLLVGETKAGKSTTGNTLLGAVPGAPDVFGTSARAASVTRDIQASSTTAPSGQVWRVLDSPGFHDTFLADETEVDARLRFSGLSPRGLDVLVLVLPCMRYTAVEQAQLLRVEQLFPNATEYLAVAFAACRDPNGTAFRTDLDLCARKPGDTSLLCQLYQHLDGRVMLFPSLDTRVADRRAAFTLLDRLGSVSRRPYGAEEFDRAQAHRAALQRRIALLGNPSELLREWQQLQQGWLRLEELEAVVVAAEAEQANRWLSWSDGILADPSLIARASAALFLALFGPKILMAWTMYGVVVQCGVPGITPPSPVPQMLLTMMPAAYGLAALLAASALRLRRPSVDSKPAAGSFASSAGLCVGAVQPVVIGYLAGHCLLATVFAVLTLLCMVRVDDDGPGTPLWDRRFRWCWVPDTVRLEPRGLGEFRKGGDGAVLQGKDRGKSMPGYEMLRWVRPNPADDDDGPLRGCRNPREQNIAVIEHLKRQGKHDMVKALEALPQNSFASWRFPRVQGNANLYRYVLAVLNYAAAWNAAVPQLAPTSFYLALGADVLLAAGRAAEAWGEMWARPPDEEPEYMPKLAQTNGPPLSPVGGWRRPCTPSRPPATPSPMSASPRRRKGCGAVYQPA